MRSIGVVPIEPVRDDAEGVVATLEAMEPHALLLQRQEDSLDRAVLLRLLNRVKGTDGPGLIGGNVGVIGYDEPMLEP